MDWEAIREGIYDMRTIATLKALASRAEAGTEPQKQVAARARAELQSVLSVDDTISQYTYAKALSDDEFNGLRLRIAEQTMALQKALK